MQQFLAEEIRIFFVSDFYPKILLRHIIVHEEEKRYDNDESNMKMLLSRIFLSYVILQYEIKMSVIRECLTSKGQCRFSCHSV